MQETAEDRQRANIRNPSVLVVLLNWNNSEETLTAVDAVLKMDYPNFAVLIVDNGLVGRLR